SARISTRDFLPGLDYEAVHSKGSTELIIQWNQPTSMIVICFRCLPIFDCLLWRRRATHDLAFWQIWGMRRRLAQYTIEVPWRKQESFTSTTHLNEQN